MEEPINWKFIVNTIKSGKCILFLGPGFLKDKKGEPSHEALLSHLKALSQSHIKNYYEKDDLFLFPDGMSKTMTYYEIKDFYKKGFDTSNFEKISELPFEIIVSINPDCTLHEVFKKKEIEHQVACFNKAGKSNHIDPPSASLPLLYNLFGSVDYEESMLLTHDDLFDFLLATLGKTGLPQELRDRLNQADNFIFLGFGFDKWYMQILLRLLNPDKEKIKFAIEPDFQQENSAFYIEQFKVNFGEVDIDAFVNELYAKCEEENILREIGGGELSIFEKAENLLADDQQEPALQILKTCPQVQEQEMEDDILLLLSKTNRLKRKIDKGIIMQDEAEVEKNRITQTILELIKELKTGI